MATTQKNLITLRAERRLALATEKMAAVRGGDPRPRSFDVTTKTRRPPENGRGSLKTIMEIKLANCHHQPGDSAMDVHPATSRAPVRPSMPGIWSKRPVAAKVSGGDARGSNGAGAARACQKARAKKQTETDKWDPVK